MKLILLKITRCLMFLSNILKSFKDVACPNRLKYPAYVLIIDSRRKCSVFRTRFLAVYIFFSSILLSVACVACGWGNVWSVCYFRRDCEAFLWLGPVPLPFIRNSSPIVVRLCLPNAPIVFKALVFVVENKRESIRVQGDIIVRLFPLETYGSGHHDTRALLLR